MGSRIWSRRKGSNTVIWRRVEVGGSESRSRKGCRRLGRRMG